MENNKKVIFSIIYFVFGLMFFNPAISSAASDVGDDVASEAPPSETDSEEAERLILITTPLVGEKSLAHGNIKLPGRGDIPAPDNSHLHRNELTPTDYRTLPSQTKGEVP